MRILAVSMTLLLTSPCLALDAEEIKALAQKPHSRDGLMTELKIYPEDREYEVTTKSGKPGEELRASPKLVAREKTVKGRYVISTARPAGTPEPFIMVVTYEPSAVAYRKWILLPDGTVGESIGTAIPKTRSIAWTSKSPAGERGLQILTIELHRDDGSAWRKIVIEDGKTVYITEGTARKIK